jgi:hypothetical protein
MLSGAEPEIRSPRRAAPGQRSIELDRGARLRPARELQLALLAGTVISVIQWAPALREPFSTGFGDWQMIQHNWEAAYVSLTRFGEWPLWDPFHCGGVTILGNPESQLYSPWFWLAFPLGTVLAVKFMLVSHIALGLGGMYWLARRRYRLQVPSSALAALAWACSGRFAWDGAGGHATFLPFAYAPWLVYFIHRRRNIGQEIAATAGLLVLTLFAGGTYPLPYFLLMLVVECGLRALASRAPLASLRFGLFALVCTALAGAVRFIPIQLTLREFPRQVPNADALSLPEVLDMLTVRKHSWRAPGHPFVWPEYGSYVGWTVVVLALIGGLITLRRGPRHLLFGLGLYGGLMLGNFAEFAPFSLLHALPFYDSLRVPSRFAVLFTFYLALLAACALDRVQTSWRTSWSRALASVLVLGYGIDLLWVTWPIIDRWTEPPLIDADADPVPNFHLVNRDYYHFYASYPQLNLGTPSCYVGGMNWAISHALWLGDRPQVRADSKRALVRDSGRTPQRFWADVSASAPVRVILNQNYARGFTSNLGTIVSDRGRLAVELPAGQHALRVRYRPPEFWPSAAVSGGGLALLLWLARRRRPRFNSRQTTGVRSRSSAVAARARAQ